MPSFRPDGNLAGIGVLVAEDNPINRILVASLLKSAGAVVEVAEDGGEAVTAIRNGSFDVVLMDIEMPVMNGFEAVELIRMEARFADLPVIALTGLSVPGTKEKCLANMNDFLEKPIDGKTLIRTVQYHARHLGVTSSSA